MATMLIRNFSKNVATQGLYVARRCLASDAGAATMPFTFGSPHTVRNLNYGFL